MKNITIENAADINVTTTPGAMIFYVLDASGERVATITCKRPYSEKILEFKKKEA
jgi:hypothetical protein